jgi:MFS family permease
MTVESNVQQGVVQSNPKVKDRWKSAFSMAFAGMMDNNEGTGFITAMFPLIRAQLGMTLGMLGWMAALPKVMAVFFGPFWASVARKYNRKTILIFVTGVWGLWAIAIGMAQNITQLVIFLVISLIGASASQPLMQELLMDLFGDDERGKAVSVVFGLAGLVMLPMAGVNAWLSGMDSGWRYGFYGAGVMSAISGLLIWVFLKDPGRGASEIDHQERDETRKEDYGLVKWSEVVELFKVKTFVLMLGQRVLSGHLLMMSFGVVYMTDVLKLDLKNANLMMMPLFMGAMLGMLAFGFIGDWIHRKYPKYGRIGTIQFLQGMYVILAFFGTQFVYDSLAIYGAIFFFMGFFASSNMAVNRPIVASVVKPELRGTAFALFVSVFESIAWGIFNVAAGQIGEAIGLKPVFLVVLVVIMLVNTLFITLIYKPYAHDVKALQDYLKGQEAGA